MYLELLIVLCQRRCILYEYLKYMYKDHLISIKSSIPIVIAEQYDHKAKIKIKYSKLFRYSGHVKLFITNKFA